MALSINLFLQCHTTPYCNLRHGIILNTRASLGVSSSNFRSSRQTISCTTKLSEQTPIRRSGDYQPANWDFDYVQSLKNEYAEAKYIDRANVLKKQVKMMMLDQEVEPLRQLELIDDLQRLGLSYHFQDEIRFILSTFARKLILRICQLLEKIYMQHLGHYDSSDNKVLMSPKIFSSFKDEKGDFKQSHCQDIKGMLQLYEASYLQTENEITLDSARYFAAKHLREQVDDKRIDQEFAVLVQHALELPLHWRMLRLEARWFLDVYEKRADRIPILLELAKLDFNIVPATYQDGLKHASRWWRSTCLAENLTFGRDRLVENFFWMIGIIFDPQHGYCRRMLTRINALITAIDDVYDVYGTLDELKLFTDAVERSDIEATNQLPDYMKICYFALFNSTNQIAYDVMKEQGIHIFPYLKNAWADLCRTYLQEAKWYHSGYVPTLAEYLDNGWISISAPVILVHNYFFVNDPIKKEYLIRTLLVRRRHDVIMKLSC